MNRERAKELLPIIQAFAEGKSIQYRFDNEPWKDSQAPTFNHETDYRIKPLEFPPLPEGMEWSNPGKKTPEEVGDGWRLLTTQECDCTWIEGGEFWRDDPHQSSPAHGMP